MRKRKEKYTWAWEFEVNFTAKAQELGAPITRSTTIYADRWTDIDKYARKYLSAGVEIEKGIYMPASTAILSITTGDGAEVRGSNVQVLDGQKIDLRLKELE